MCLIHIRPPRGPSPDAMVVPSRPITRGPLPAPPLSPHAYHSPRTSRPPHSRTQIPRPPTSPRVSGPLGEPLQRLSIHSREQFEAQQLKQLERERERDPSTRSSPPLQSSDQGSEQHRQPQSQAPQPHFSPPPPSAPEPPSPSPRHPSYDRARPSPHTSATCLPPLRRGSDYTYGSAPIPALSNGSLAHPPQARIEASPASKDKENIPLANMVSKVGHRRRESGVSVVNGKDGSLVERERPRLGRGGRSSSLSVGGGRRLSTGPGRRSAGNVGGVVAGGDVGGGGSGSGSGSGMGGGAGGGDVWGGNPRGSQRSVRERVVIVEEGRRRREYVRWEG